ncbi:MAG: hypothetical protein COA57_16475, partial [Flavobacteriales bacterium]
YNLLNYGNYNSWCTTSNNNVNDKDVFLKTIVKYVMPDVFCVNELGVNMGGGDNVFAIRIRDNVLNTDGITYYQKAAHTGSSSLVNMIYYNSNKLTLHSQEVIEKNLSGGNLVREVDLYKMYYNDPGLLSNGDTIFITFIVAHLKAGSNASDEAQRADATEAVMDNLNQKNIAANYVLSGDFNTKNSSEISYSNLISHPNTKITFTDPIGQPGNWNSNSSFAGIHTQSTRSSNTNGDCFAGGGMDDRFDFIMTSNYVINSTDRVYYIPGSYAALGQDATFYNQEMPTSGNTTVPNSVANALYEMSDHLPVVMDLLVRNWPSSISEERDKLRIKITNPFNDWLNISIEGITSEKLIAKIYDISGRLMLETNISNTDRINTKILKKGFYLLQLSENGRVLKTVKVGKI